MDEIRITPEENIKFIDKEIQKIRSEIREELLKNGIYHLYEKIKILRFTKRRLKKILKHEKAPLQDFES